MMPEYIERTAAIATVCKGCNKEFPNDPCEPAECYIQQGLFKLPAADVAEVRHGEWLPYPSDAYMKCSVCGMEYHKSRMPDVVGYCPNPNCGAKMDGGNNHES